MYSTATTADYASGIDAEPKKPAEDTGLHLGEALKDFAIDAVARPGLTLARTAVEGYRLADPENKTMAELGDTLGSGEKALLAERSPRARLFDTTSLTPGVGEKSFTSAPIEASVRALLPSAPYLAAAPFTGGASAVVGLGVLQGTSAVLGENVAQLRDAATQTPVDKMMQSPRFVDLMRQFDGDEAKAREAIFRESLDPKSLAASFLVNAAQLPAVLRPLQKGVTGVGKRIAGAGLGAGEGALLGGGEGLTDAYIEQVGKVRRGEQAEIDHGELASGAGRGAIFAGPTSVAHAIAPPTRAPSGKITTPSPGTTTTTTPAGTPTTTPTGPPPIGTETTTTLNEQMNDAGRTPPSPTMPAVEPEPTMPPGVAPPGEAPPAAAPPGVPVETAPGEPVAPLPTRPRPDMPVDHSQPLVPEAPLPPEAPGRPAAPVDRTQPFVPDRMQDHSTPLSRETANQPAGEMVSRFRTAKGSDYILFGDGTTIRNKASRPEHPGDSGIKERSQATVFVTPEHANQLGLVQAMGGPGPMRLAKLPDGRVGVQYTDGPQRGGFERRTVGEVFSQPRVGLMPLEIWNGGTGHHFGNEITEVGPVPRAAPGTAYQPPTNLGQPQPTQFAGEASLAPEAPLREASARREGAPLQPYEGQQIDPNLQRVAEAEQARAAAAEAERVKPASQAAAYAGLAERQPAKGPPAPQDEIYARLAKKQAAKEPPQKKAPEAKAAPKPAAAPVRTAPAAAPKAEPAKAAKAKEVSQRRTAAKAEPKPAEQPARKTLTLPAKAEPKPAPTPAPAKGERGPAHRAVVAEARALQAEGRELALIPESKQTKAVKKRRQEISEEIRRRLTIPADVVIDIPAGGTSMERWNKIHQAATAEGYGHEGASQLANRQIETEFGPRQTLTTESVLQAERKLEQDAAVSRRQQAASILKPGRREMPVDAEGLPADRLPRVKGEPTAEQRQAQDAHEQLDNVGEPDHPLITPAETPHDTMARVKKIVADGQAGDISSFVDAAFLDDLATVTTGAKIYHAPYDVTSNLGTRAGAFYDPGTDRVVLPTDVSPQNYVRAAVHESVHAATEGMLLTDPKFAAEVSGELERARAKASAQGVDLNNLPRDLYGLTNPSEFLAESKSNPAFREFLNSVKAPTNPVIQGARTVLNALYRTIRDAWRRVIGAKNGDTALDVLFYDQSTVLGRTDAIVKRAISQLKKNGRPAVQGGTVRPERRYLNVTRGAQDIYDNLTQGVGHAAGEVKHFWNTFDQVKARGLDFATPSDMTQIGSTEFKKLSAAAFKIDGLIEGRTEQMRDVNKRRIAKVAKIYNSWSKEARQEAREFIMDEGMHTAFADVPLNDPKNAHIDPASLANAQVVRQHDEMRQRHDSAAARLPDFKQWRDGVYSFFSDIEKAMRWSTVHSLVEHSELVPATVTGKARADAHIALTRAASVDLTLRPQDTAALQRAGVDLQDPRIADVVSAIRDTAPLQKIEGPYTPWSRHGDQAIYGEFTTHDAPNGIRLGTEMNEVPGQALGSNKMAFPTEAEARAYEKQVSDDLGIAQLDGGEVFMRNGARVTDANGRPLGNNEVEAILKRAQKAADALQNNKTITAGGRALTAAELQQRVDAARGIAKHYYVGFQPKILQMYATEAEAARAREDLLEQYKGHQVGGQAGLQITAPQDVVRHEGRQNEHFVGTQMQSLINRTRATTTYQNLHPTQQAELTRGMTEAVARYTMRRGINQRKLPRGYVRGMSTDVMASMDEYNGMSSRYIAKVEHAAQVRDADQAMKDFLKDNRFTQGDNNAKANERVYNAMHQKRNDPPMRDTKANRWIDRIIRWTMLDKLPDVGYLMVQAFDPANSTFPMLASRHGGIKSAATMAGFYRHADVFTRHARSAGRDIAQSFVGGADVTNWRDHMQKSVANHPMAAGLQDMYRQAADRAVYSIASSMDYTSSLANRAMIDRVSGRLSGILGGLTTGVENLSRFVGLGAAYELEMGKQLKDAGGNFATPEAAAAAHQTAVEYAIKTAHNANGVMAEFNKPRFFTKSPAHRLFTLFRSYSQRFAMRYIEGFGGAWRASRDTLQGKARSAEDVELAKRLGWMLVTQGLLAGALGLPTEPFTIPLNAAYMVGLSPYNSQDMEAGFRRFVDSKLGNKGGEIFSRGIFRAIGWDLHGRMSQATLLGPHGAPGSTKSKDIMAATLNYFGGAPVGTAFEAYKGLQAGVEGVKALSEGATSVAYKKFNEAAKNLILFRQLSDVLAAFNGMDPDAQRSQSGRARTAPYTTTEAIVKGITGYEPSRISEGRERSSEIDNVAKRIRNERKQYSDAFAQAKTEKERNTLRDRIRAWNAGKPIEHQLSFADLRRAQVTRQKAEAQPADQGGITADRITRPLFGQYGFYNQ